MSELATMAATIAAASCPEDVFGSLGTSDRLIAIGKTYKHIVSVIHPDKHQGSPELPAAEAALARLTALRADADAKVKAGTYGKRNVAAPKPPPKAADPMVVQVKGKRYIVGELLCQGDICDVYACTYADEKGAEVHGVFKIAQSAVENDLVENEAKMLAKIRPPTAPSEKLYRLFPRLIDSFVLRSGKSNRRVNVLRRVGPTSATVADVLKAYPDGIDYRDMAWMFKRVLGALGHTHRKGIVHGAVLPEHIILHFDDHGAKLLDWSYAVKIGEPVRAISVANKAFYAPEILKKRPTSPATDIYMAARIASELLSKQFVRSLEEQKVAAFLNGCMLASPISRPDDAWDLHDDFGALLQKLCGKPAFRPFAMPVGRMESR